MNFDILTIFPEMFSPLNQSIMKIAQDKGLVNINIMDIREYSKNKHKKVDDYPYGGGSGMVMTAQPIIDAFNSINEKYDYKPRIVYLSPQGKVLSQSLAKELSKEKHLVLLCGHYEGIDERVIDSIVDDEVSIGDYVLTGGEMAAMVLVDCISRLISGVLSNDESAVDESFSDGLLEYPQYTRPFEYNEMIVPEVLISGHHKNIEKWRRQQSLLRTKQKRPDIFEKLNLSKEDKKILDELENRKR